MYRIPFRNGVVCNGLQNKEAKLESYRAVMVVIDFRQRDWGGVTSVSWLKYLSLEMVLKANFPIRNAFIVFNLAHSMPSNIVKNVVGENQRFPLYQNSHVFAFLDLHGFLVVLSEFPTGYLQSPQSYMKLYLNLGSVRRTYYC